MTHAERLAERFLTQSASCNLSPERLLLQELLDLQRNYMIALTILEKKSDANSNRR